MMRDEHRLVLLIVFLVIFCGFQGAARAQTDQAKHETQEAAERANNAGYVEDVSFAVVEGKERVTVAVSRQTGTSVESSSGNAVVLKMDNMYIPDHLRKPLGVGALANVLRVLPQQKTEKGGPSAHVKIEMEETVPYSVRQEGNAVIVDFNVSSLPGARKRAAAGGTEQAPPKAAAVSGGIVRTETKSAAQRGPNGQRLIDLDFQDADVRMLLRLLAEEGRVNIVYGDDVKGNMNISLKGVPWEKALATVLDVKGLTRIDDGNVITVMTNERRKKVIEEVATAEQQRIKAEDTRKEREQKLLVEEGRLKQINIEAKIVEVDTDFSRELGLRWGYAYKDTWNGRDVGIVAGNSATSTSGTTVTTLPSGIGLTNSNLAVNFPSASAALDPAIGIIIGSSKFILAAKLDALETTGTGKIISSPKVMTMDNVEAKIGQGEEIPYIVRDKDGSPTVEMKEAKLSLRVKPKITAEGKISMEIETTNKYADWSKTNTLNENPPLVSSDVLSKVVVNDGDTIVIGGIYKNTETSSVSGIPYLSQIPILGWLFKTTSKNSTKREILIFVTPTIIKREG